MAINLNKVRGDRVYRFVVREGDTLNSLTELLGVERSALEEANPGLDLDALVKGMELIIPAGKALDNVPDGPEEAGPVAMIDAATSAIEDAVEKISEDHLNGSSPVHEEATDEDATNGAGGSAATGVDANETKIVVLRVNSRESASASSAADIEVESSEVEEEPAPVRRDLPSEVSPKTAAEGHDATNDVSEPSRFEPISWKPFPKV